MTNISQANPWHFLVARSGLWVMQLCWTQLLSSLGDVAKATGATPFFAVDRTLEPNNWQIWLIWVLQLFHSWSMGNWKQISEHLWETLGMTTCPAKVYRKQEEEDLCKKSLHNHLPPGLHSRSSVYRNFSMENQSLGKVCKQNLASLVGPCMLMTRVPTEMLIHLPTIGLGLWCSQGTLHINFEGFRENLIRICMTCGFLWEISTVTQLL